MSVIRCIEASDVPQLFRVRAATDENRLILDQLAALGIDENSVREKLLSSHQGWLCEKQRSVVGSGKVYKVEPIGQIEEASHLTNQKFRGHPSMSCRSREPLRVTGEVTEWPLYHGTRADLRPGDLIKPGHTPNFGNRARTNVRLSDPHARCSQVGSGVSRR